MALKLVKAFAEKLTVQEYARQLTVLANDAARLPNSLEAKQSLSNLFVNFKTNSADYCTSKSAVVSTVHWAHKLQHNDPELWVVLKEGTLKHMNDFDSKSLALVMKGLAERVDEETKQDLISEVKKIVKNLDQRAIITIGKALKVDMLTDQSPKSFINPIRMLYYLQTLSPGTETELRGEELSIAFDQHLDDMHNAQAFCNILNEFNRLRIIPPVHILRRIEAKAVAPSFTLNSKDYQHILKAFNHETLFGRISQEFYEEFEVKLLKDLKRLPCHLILTSIVKHGFDSEAVTRKAIDLWKASLTTSQNKAEVFREGFYAMVQTEYYTESLLNWSLEMIKELLPYMQPLDYAILLRALTIRETYDPQVLTLLVDQIKSHIGSYNDTTLSVIYVTLKSLEVDQPPCAAELLAKLDPCRGLIKAAYDQNVKRFSSDSQKQLAIMLTALGYKFEEGVVLEDIYETDCLFRDRKLIVEMMGWPFHTNQYGGKIRASTQMKLRHLQKLGWNVISVFTWKQLSDRLPEMIESIDLSAPPKLMFLYSRN
mmetsp:Transcript_10937/g.21376  ORF Transcript_10937/g.21376 Transcript_10937/m.21376 type:complete len:541 (-) Transcript_10937:20-1642(-)